MITEEQRERQQLTQQLADYGLDVIQEWMRIIELDDVAGIQFQARLRWQEDGTAIMGETQYSEEYGRFRFTVNVEDLGMVPPIGPEDDLGVYGITDERAGEPVSAGQEEALERMGREMASARLVFEGPSAQSMAAAMNREALANAGLTEEPQWVLRTWTDVVTGDEVRMPATDVTATIAMRYRHPSEDPAGRSWHVVDGKLGHWGDHFVQPGECVVLLQSEARPRFMNPAAPVEIKLAPTEVEALELMGWHMRMDLKRK